MLRNHATETVGATLVVALAKTWFLCTLCTWDGWNDTGENVNSGNYCYYLLAGKYEAAKQRIIRESISCLSLILLVFPV